jgi:glycosyltransferase involved in cell wall biosynthesis
MRAAYKKAAAVVAVSGTAARVLTERAGLEPRKTTVVHAGADSALIPDVKRDTSREPTLLVVSALMPHKNLERTIELFARLHQNCPDLRLQIAGADWRGFGTTLEERARLLGVDAAVVFLGQVGPDTLADLYSRAALLLHLSDCESFGLPAVEAMRHGLPVVATRHASLPEVIRNAALLIDPADLDTSFEQVCALLESDSQRTSLERRGQQRAARLRWRDTAAGIGTVLHQILDAR